MNIYEADVLRTISHNNKQLNQREIAKITRHSLGVVNKAVNSLLESGYIDKNNLLTEKGFQLLKDNRPKRAIILAAGYGMRMVPINFETPKALLNVHGECLIERQIRHLHEAGIEDIYVVVGFLKEKFEYLIDEFNVHLIVNSEYSTKGNMYSLKMASKYLENSYIIPSDIWCEANPFNDHELYSWYMVSDLIDKESEVRVNRKYELVRNLKSDDGNKMLGISYLNKEDGAYIKDKITEITESPKFEHAFWEEALYVKDRMMVPAKLVSSKKFIEINTYEQLRELDNNSANLQSDALSIIMDTLNVEENEIKEITVLKKGMTNRSFLFSVYDKKYIMRIPGEGTNQLINRQEEASVYNTIKDKNICDEILYINPDNGYKITRFLDNATVCDPYNQDNLKKCMSLLKDFHNMKLKVSHVFDLYEKIDYYESLWNGNPSIYKDYKKTKEKVLSLKPYIDSHVDEMVLSHIDSVPDNFLFAKDDDGNEILRLIDWEYSSMQDPHLDIAMFCIYSLYDKANVDNLIDIYFDNACDAETRVKIYCYIATAGLLWSNWCEYKQNLGVEFGEYSIRQYHYAKEYYRYAMDFIKKDVK